MHWLALFFALEAGWMPAGDFVMYDPPSMETVAGSFYTEFEARVTAWGFLFVGGSVKTFVWLYEGEYTFAPERSLYSLEAGVKFGPVEVGFRHYCTHPTWIYLWAFRYGDAEYGQAARWEGAYEEVYLRFEMGR